MHSPEPLADLRRRFSEALDPCPKGLQWDAGYCGPLSFRISCWAGEAKITRIFGRGLAEAPDFLRGIAGEARALAVGPVEPLARGTEGVRRALVLARSGGDLERVAGLLETALEALREAAQTSGS